MEREMDGSVAGGSKRGVETYTDFAGLLGEDDRESLASMQLLGIDSFEEVPGAWSEGIDQEEIFSLEDRMKQSAKKRLVTSFVFGLVSCLSLLFLIASLLNGDLPRYGVEAAEAIHVPYDEWVSENIITPLSTSP